jgi:glycosyltransferase involved in cell wall biosynthesis
VPDGLFFDGGAPEAIERGGLGVLASAAGFSARMIAEVARRALGWDAIAAHWLAPSAVAAAVAPRRVPILAIAHGGDVHMLARARLLAPVLALLVARDARVAFVSDELRRRALDGIPRALASRVAARSIVQPMGVDDTRAAAIAERRATRTPTDRATIVVLARLVPVKSVDTAIAAMAHVRTPATLVIAGDGPLRADLAAHAARFGDRVQLAGWLGADARDDLLARADVVVVPSAPTGVHARTEGTPMAALEALTAGIPLVASATGGLRELAHHGATLVTPRDPHALARAIDHAISRAPHALPRDSRFGWRVVGEALDRHWRHEQRAHRYAPASHRAQSNASQWSSRPSDSADSANHSRDLLVTPTW